MERERIGHAELEYDVVGSGEPVVFIHGAFIADVFRPVLDEPVLTDRYRLIHYHRRGYAGSSRASESNSVAQQAADCRALLHYLGVNQSHVVGHSYGGAVALQLASDTPTVAHSLTLLEPALMAGASAQGYRESLARGIERYRKVGPKIVVDEFMQARWPPHRDVLDHVLPGAFDQAVADAETCFDYELPGLLGWHFDEAEARHLPPPTLSVLDSESEALWDRFGEVHRLLLAWLPHAEGFSYPARHTSCNCRTHMALPKRLRTSGHATHFGLVLHSECLQTTC